MESAHLDVGSAASLADLFLKGADSVPDRQALVVLDRNGAESRTLTYAGLATAALTQAGRFARDLSPGSVILIALSDPADFVPAFGGAILAGMIPAPMPQIRKRLNTPGFTRLAEVLKHDGAAAVLADEDVLDWLGPALVAVGCAPVPLMHPAPTGSVAPLRAPAPTVSDQTAYLQYTSGSTQRPKAVVLRHDNILAHLHYMQRTFARGEPLRTCGWLPLHHDMGLVGHVFSTLYETGLCVLLDPSSFLARPEVWLNAISRYRANASAAPTFALSHAVDHANPTPDCDLSTWANIYVGSETVELATLQRFERRFRPLGLPPHALRPVYGLAEATLLAAGGGASLSQLLPRVESHRIALGQSRELIGYPVNPGLNVSIRRDGSPVAEGETGTVWVSGASVSPGYLGDAPTTDGMDTGDLGYLRDGHLYLTGRQKDCVILRGQNHAAEDLEAVIAAAMPAPCAGLPCAVAADLESGSESLWLFQEAPRHLGRSTAMNIAQATTAALSDGFGIRPDRVLFLPKGLLPRTANHKIARTQAVELTRRNELKTLYDFSPRDIAAALPGDDPVVIVAAACRFPGAGSLAEFWDNLAAGVDSITEVPPDRWNNDVFYDPTPATPGKLSTKCAGFIDGIDRFDADLFGISGIEATEMDPQQRLLLETCYRLFEDAGWKANAIKGSDTGVFIGLSTNDYLYSKIKLKPGMTSFNAYSGLGNANSVAANRLSYIYDLHGPSMTVDTACSSSLTAFHLGVQAIRNGECTAAVVGGVNAILSPGPTITLSQFGMMAPDGRCKTFDAGADGYVRSEGCGLVMLKRRSAALRDGDHILAIVRASVTGQDGASNGITHPNAAAQDRLIARAQALAGLDSARISYVEAHGTGTAVGDPAEVQTLIARYGDAGTPCALGSVKANIGHLEAAAGIASVIKVLCQFRAGKIAPQIHVKTQNPALHLGGTRFDIPLDLRDWAPDGGRVAAVSSFGFGGALAHVILEDADETPERTGEFAALHPYPIALSAPTAEALRTTVTQVHDWLTGFPQIAHNDLCRTLATARTDHRYRLTALAPSRKAAQDKLSDWLASGRTAVPVRADVRPAFLFTGQGEQYLFMGRELYERFAVFRDAFDRCTAAVDNADMPFTLADLAFRIEDTRQWRDIYMQPILFAVQYALARLLEACGIRPDVMIGHSMGEYAVAALAGCMTPEEAMRILYRRGALTETLRPGNFMVLIYANEATVRAEIDAEKLSIAALNTPNKTVISGDGAAAERVRKHFEDRGVESYFLKSNTAFHSQCMDPILDDFRASLAHFRFQPPRIRWISSVTGAEMTEAPDADYWVRHMRDTVRFYPAIETLRGAALDFIEIGPGASALAGARETLKSREALYLRTLNPIKGERTESYFTLDAVCKLYEAGLNVNWEPMIDGHARPRDVPGLPFCQKRYWIQGISAEDFTRFADGAEPTPASQHVPVIEPQDTDAGLHYQLNWKPIGPVTPAKEGKTVNWLVIGPNGGHVSALMSALRARGQGAFWIDTQAGRSRSRADARLTPDASRAEWGRVLNRIFTRKSRAGVKAWRTVVLSSDPATGALTPEGLDATQAAAFGTLIPLCQALHDQAYVEPLWIVTRGAQAVGRAAAENLVDASVWGFGKTLFLEHPAWRGGMIDLAADGTGDIGALVDKALNPDFEPCIAIRDGQQFVQELRPAPVPAPPQKAFRPDGAFVITGGLGGLGLECADWIVARGGRHLILLGRRAPDDPDVIDRINKHRTTGATVEIRQCDVTDHAELRAVFDDLGARGIPLRGIVHAAGENWFAKVIDLDPARFLRTLKIKTSAALALDHAARGADLDCFYLFSSVSALWGSVNLSHYSAANQMLDMISLARTDAGLPSISVDWGPWDEVGMSAKTGERAMMEKLGLRLLPPARALKALEATEAAGRPLSLIADMDWDAYRVFIDYCLQRSLFDQVAVQNGAPVLKTADRVAAIRAASPEEARRMIERAVRMELKSVTLIDSADTIDDGQRFNFMGMDSLMALSFAAALETYFQFEMPSTLVYNYPTIRDVTDYIHAELRGPQGDAPKVVPTPGTWIHPLNETQGPSVLCLPFTGAGASIFTGLGAALDGQAHVRALQIPGREELDHLSPITVMADLVELLLAHWPDDAPEVLFGHSMGAVVAFELLRQVEARGLARPARLIVSGAHPPGQLPDDPLHRLEDEAFLREIAARYTRQGRRDGANPVLAARLPLLRADLTLFETHSGGSDRIDTPISAIRATGDNLVDQCGMLDWQARTTGAFAVVEIEGDHHIVSDRPGDLAGAILQSLRDSTSNNRKDR